MKTFAVSLRRCAAARRRGLWLLVAALLVVVPKCVFCLAAYAALIFGIGAAAEWCGEAPSLHGGWLGFAIAALVAAMLFALWRRRARGS
ncbi:hypothetical protein DB347_20690 [Opitutaceae bacterium EW11]|nr:hypothetical protein DB347_20690 [Opitutaceae bacterium EW11]